ncbi:MAG: DUF1501 domain-containing protein [Rhodospirillales bacterium]
MIEISRRHFIAGAASASGLLLTRPSFAAPSALPTGPQWDRVLVLVQLQGGNDGLNTVVPYDDPVYRRLRPNLAVARDQVVQLTPELGFNPTLKGLMPSWRDKDLAIVQGVGYPNPNRSHFRSIEIWDTASNSAETLSEGWVARAFEGTTHPANFTFDAVVIDNNTLPVSGPQMQNIVLRDVDQFIAQANRIKQSGGDRGNPALKHLLNVQGEIHRAAFSLRDRMSQAPVLPVAMPAGPFGQQLDLAAKLMLARTPLSVIKLSLGSFDTHARQRETHEKLLGQLGDGLAAFRDCMKKAGLWDKVLVLTYSEFGRRANENGSAGTDHGTAAVQFAMGGKVKGSFYGRQPSLTDLSEGDVKHAVDFRQVYSTVARNWWGLPRDSLGGRGKALDFV